MGVTVTGSRIPGTLCQRALRVFINEKNDNFEDQETESLKTELVGLEKRISEELEYSEKVPLDDQLDEFSIEFRYIVLCTLFLNSLHPNSI